MSCNETTPYRGAFNPRFTLSGFPMSCNSPRAPTARHSTVSIYRVSNELQQGRYVPAAAGTGFNPYQVFNELQRTARRFMDVQISVSILSGFPMSCKQGGGSAGAAVPGFNPIRFQWLQPRSWATQGARSVSILSVSNELQHNHARKEHDVTLVSIPGFS